MNSITNLVKQQKLKLIFYIKKIMHVILLVLYHYSYNYYWNVTD